MLFLVIFLKISYNIDIFTFRYHLRGNVFCRNPSCFIFNIRFYRANLFVTVLFVTVPDTNELIFLGDAWRSRAKTAYYRAEKACGYEQTNLVVTAGYEWQKIFGQQIPRTV